MTLQNRLLNQKRTTLWSINRTKMRANTYTHTLIIMDTYVLNSVYNMTSICAYDDCMLKLCVPELLRAFQQSLADDV